MVKKAAPKVGNRVPDVETNNQNAKPSNADAKKKRQVTTKTKRLPTAPPPHKDLWASKEILGLFQRTFADLFARDDLHELLQTVKGHLFNRDFSAAFGHPDYLDAYVIRWSPARALAYRNVFLELCDEVKEVFQIAGRPGTTTEIVCMGGGAGAELVGTAAALKHLLPRLEEGQQKTESNLHVTALDIAAWDPCFNKLQDAVLESLIPDSYPNVFAADFHQVDVLSAELPKFIKPETKLITLMFTTNELYTAGKAETTRMLLSLAGMVEKGCLLMVLESAGSYSTIKIGDKTFGMGMLLEYTLLGAGGKGGDWNLITGEEARWYRLPKGETVGTGLKYPLALEDMRYFVRVFQKR